MGNVLTDLTRNLSTITFYGPNGEWGKNILVLNVSTLLGKGAKWTVTDLVGKSSKWPDAELVIDLAEKRVITRDEYGIEDDINNNSIKGWASNAPI